MTASALAVERIRVVSFTDSVWAVLAAAGTEEGRAWLRAGRPHRKLDTLTSAMLRSAASALNALAVRW